jgi:dTMP kinase
MGGRFITVDGGEGAGKTTQLAFMRDYLTETGKRIVMTREPGGTPLGEEIRSLLLSHRDGGMGDDAELLLVFAARAEHVQRVIRPALARGDWVLCDRFSDASYAYQGGGRGIAAERIAALERWVLDGLRPDLTLLFDLPVEQGLARRGRHDPLDRFESEQRDFLRRVRQAYLERSRSDPKRYRLIDATRGVGMVRAEVRNILARFIDETGHG